MAFRPGAHRRLMVPAPRSAAREQAGHARDVAVVLAGLVGAAVDDIFDRGPSRPPGCAHQDVRRHGAGRRHARRPGAAVKPWGADGVADECLSRTARFGYFRRWSMTRRTPAGQRAEWFSNSIVHLGGDADDGLDVVLRSRAMFSVSVAELAGEFALDLDADLDVVEVAVARARSGSSPTRRRSRMISLDLGQEHVHAAHISMSSERR